MPEFNQTELTDRQTDRDRQTETDRQTDRQTDSLEEQRERKIGQITDCRKEAEDHKEEAPTRRSHRERMPLPG